MGSSKRNSGKWLAAMILSVLMQPSWAQLTIQEESAGFCSTDGIIENSSAGEGFTGAGFLDYVSFAKWSVNVTTAGTYTLTWRYALGGGNTDSRNGQVYHNDVNLVDTVIFDHTGSWASYAESSIMLDLNAGVNEIRIKSFVTPYLPHIDYFNIAESGVTTGDCITRYSLSVGINDANAGTVSYEPVQEFYTEGTEITLTATPNTGYFFQSWEGNDADDAQVYKLKIRKNTVLEGRFLPEGTTQVPGVYGYATVQNDKGTPYLLTGGSLGDTVAATSLELLQQYVSGNEPRVITLDKKLQGSNGVFIKFGSNKTLVGITDEAEIQGVRTQMNSSKNIIIKKVKFSKTITYDAMQINSGSEQIWIDSCEFYSDRDHDKDYYDGLLDIKNASSFITISHTKFHDHAKSILISSGASEQQDTVIRITFHHNYFYENGSRLPSFRFGKGHMFNNYYKSNDGGINTRLGACIRIEKNLFEQNSGSMIFNGEGEAYTQEIGNVGASSNVAQCVLNVPYEYESILEDDPNKLKALWDEDSSDPIPLQKMLESQLRIFPNPAKNEFSIELPTEALYRLTLVNLAGVQVLQTKVQGKTTLEIADLPRGMYMIRLQGAENELIQKNIILQ